MAEKPHKQVRKQGKGRLRSTPGMVAKMWKPGQSGNPKGRPPLNPIQKALRELTVETYAEVIEVAMTGNGDALQDLIDDPKTSVVQLGIAKALKRALEHSDYTVIERIAERIVGKIPEKIEIKSKNLNANVDGQTKLEAMKAAIKATQDDV